LHGRYTCGILLLNKRILYAYLPIIKYNPTFFGQILNRKVEIEELRN
jgi:hypothetical protein